MRITLRLPSLIFWWCSLLLPNASNLFLVCGFMQNNNMCGTTTTTARRRRFCTTKRKSSISAYVENPSLLSQLHGEEVFLLLSLIGDDNLRRNTLESYLLEGMAREQSKLPMGGLWDRNLSSFYERAKTNLETVSTNVQEDAWSKYVATGLKTSQNVPPQLWACVDMTVQFQFVVRSFEEETIFQ